MLEPGYDIERACKARLTNLFQRVMPGPSLPADSASGSPGIEHHDTRRASVFDRLDGIRHGLQAARTSPSQSSQNTADKASKKPCASQTAYLKPSSRGGCGSAESAHGLGTGKGKGGRGAVSAHGKGRGKGIGGGKGSIRSGFMQYDLNVKAAQHQVESRSDVLGFLNSLRERKGKRQLDDSIDAEKGASVGAPRKRRPNSMAGTVVGQAAAPAVKVTAKAGERAAPKAGLAFNEVNDQDDTADGTVRDEAGNAGPADPKATAVSEPSTVTFRRVQSRNKGKKQLRRRATEDDDSDA